MATHSIRFFMEPTEFASLVWRVADTFHLYAIRCGFGRYRTLEIADGPSPITMSDGAPARVIFLTAERPDLRQITPTRLRPGEWGWVESDVPREEGDILYIAQMAAKSDWYDPESRQIYDNPASLELFRKVVPAFRKQLKRPVWVSHILGGETRAARDIGYSDGAAEWFRNGGQLLQEGVANVRYIIEPTTAKR